MGIVCLQFDYLCVVGEWACVSVDAMRNQRKEHQIPEGGWVEVVNYPAKALGMLSESPFTFTAAIKYKTT